MPEFNDFRTVPLQIAEFWPKSLAMLGKLVLLYYLLYSRTFEVSGYELLLLQLQPSSLPPMYLLVYGQNTEMCLHKKYNDL